MSVRHPKTLEEWRAHLETLSGEALWSKASAANSTGFVQALLAEGYDGDEIEALFVLIAKRLVAVGQTPPTQGYFDLAALARG